MFTISYTLSLSRHLFKIYTWVPELLKVIPLKSLKIKLRIFSSTSFLISFQVLYHLPIQLLLSKLIISPYCSRRNSYGQIDKPETNNTKLIVSLKFGLNESGCKFSFLLRYLTSQNFI